MTGEKETRKSTSLSLAVDAHYHPLNMFEPITSGLAQTSRLHKQIFRGLICLCVCRVFVCRGYAQCSSSHTGFCHTLSYSQHENKDQTKPATRDRKTLRAVLNSKACIPSMEIQHSSAAVRYCGYRCFMYICVSLCCGLGHTFIDSVLCSTG